EALALLIVFLYLQRLGANRAFSIPRYQPGGRKLLAQRGSAGYASAPCSRSPAGATPTPLPDRTPPRTAATALQIPLANRASDDALLVVLYKPSPPEPATDSH